MSGHPRVLIVDDDEFLRKGLEFALARLGVQSVQTGDCDEFLRLATETAFDLFIVDLNLSGGRSGLELVRQLRSLQGPRPRIMMISATGDSKTILTALKGGANDFILKPLDRTHLAAKLSRYFRTQQMYDDGAFASQSSEGRAPGKITFYSRIAEIEERGVRIEGEHLLPRGTSMLLGGELIASIGGNPVPTPVPVKVVSSWAIAGSGEGRPRYGAYAEFDRGRCEVRWFRSLRRWLAERQVPAPRP